MSEEALRKKKEWKKRYTEFLVKNIGSISTVRIVVLY